MVKNSKTARSLKTGKKTVRSLPNAQTDSFRKKHFPKTTRVEWNDWRWQLTHRIRDLATLERLYELSDNENRALSQKSSDLPVALTPYYASLLATADANDPLRRVQIPADDECSSVYDECMDPLGEEPAMVAPGLVHRYPDRALFLVTNTCATYCRYCNRARMVGQTVRAAARHDWVLALNYIRAHGEIRDVLISGGDPLIMSDEKIDWLLGQLRAIEHVEFIRIGTKIPITLPQRITPHLVSVLKKYHPLWLSVHMIHPRELTPEVSIALNRIANAGIPMGSQTVLLKGVNDDAQIIKKLMHEALRNRVTPYALFQLDAIKGSSRFRVSIAKGLEIISALRGHTSGYAVPDYIIDPPGGGGKAHLVPNPIVGRDGDYVLLKNFEGKIYRYYDPA